MGLTNFSTTSRRIAAIACLTAVLTACGSGGGGDDAADASKGGVAPLRQTAPVISGTPPTVIAVGLAYDFTPGAADADGDALSFNVENAPAWAAFDGATGRLHGTPADADIGLTSGIVLSVSDGVNARSLPAFNIRVVDGGQINTAPEISGQPAGAVVVGNDYSFTPETVDADGNALTFTISNLPGWLSFDPDTGALTGTPTGADVGDHVNISISVSDGKAFDTLGPFDVSVLPPEVPVALEVRATVPSNYLWDILAETKPVYLDRTYTFASFPDRFAGLQYLLTANDDKREAVNPFIRFEVNKRVTVYVGYDVRASELPEWLEGWTNTGETWQTTDTTLDVYAQEFNAGTVGLGGNDGAESMYSVVIEAQDSSLLAAEDDTAHTQQDTPVSVDVLSNDAGLEATPLEVSVVTPPANGTATPTAFNTVYYVPEEGFVGTDSFAYAVSDASGASAAATVTITVTQASQGTTPSSFDDSYEVLQGTTLTMNVLDNDTGLFDAPLVVTVESPAASGSLTVIAGNAIEYTSDSGFTGADGFTYRITDADGEFDVASVSITVLSVNAAPTISGVPATTVVAGDSYSFVPTAFDADGDSLFFTVSNAPAWASFDADTGALTGTPQAGDAGTTNGIVISVSDGEATVALDPFSVTVAQTASGSATISWDPPTQSADGGPLNDLAGYRVYYGTSPGSYSSQVEVANPGLSSLVVDNLAPGTWYFVTTAYDAANNESAYSNVATKTIP